MQQGVIVKKASKVTRKKILGNNVKTIPGTLLTLRDGGLYPAGNQDDIEGIAIDSVKAGEDNIKTKKEYCEYYPSNPFNWYARNVTRGKLSIEDVGSYFDIEDSQDQLVNYETKGSGRQVRLEEVLSETTGIFTIPRHLHIVKGVPGKPGPTGKQGELGPEGPRGERGKQGSQGIQGPKGEKGDRGDQGEQGIRGPQGERGPQGKKGVGKRGPKGPKGDRGERGEKGERGPGFIRKGMWNSGSKYSERDIVHHDGSAWIAEQENINKEPGIDKQRSIFAQGGI